MNKIFRVTVAIGSLLALGAAKPAPPADIVVSGGLIYDGSGGAPYPGMVAICGDRIAYVGPDRPMASHVTVDARGHAITPGFVNMLGHSEESPLVDGRALSDLKQGVTLEVVGEASMAPLSPALRMLAPGRQGDLNGRFALRDGTATGAATGRIVRGRAWRGAPNGGGWRADAAAWRETAR